MYYYKSDNNILVSNYEYGFLQKIPESEAIGASEQVYLLTRLDPSISRRSFCVSDPSLAFIGQEDLRLLKRQTECAENLPGWLVSKIYSNKVTSINTEYPNWRDALASPLRDKWKINVIGLGDVGGTLITGLRLLGGRHVSQIGIYDIDENKVKRWEYEANQILPALSTQTLPEIVPITAEQFFDCDMFVFCVTVGVPPVGENVKDVRTIQFEGNSKILNMYARKARQAGFKGIFAVVSDPVDLLCKSAFLASNRNENGDMDYRGLGAEQIHGYGLGVMNARAAYFARLDPRTGHYLSEGRAFGPHGEFLVIADSIDNYDNELSLYLTDKARNANMEVRAAGYKPYVAPALSSGSLSLLATIEGSWHYSATYMGGVFMGARNRLLAAGLEIERLNLPQALMERLENTYERLGSIL